MFKNYWWKILGVLLVLYSVVMGLYIPLGPGILEVTPTELKQGQANTITVTGHNTHFKEAGSSLQIWILYDKENYCAKSLEIKDDEHLVAHFDAPVFTAKSPINLVGNNDIDGTFQLDEAFWFNAAEKGDTTAGKATCSVKVKTNEAAYTHYPFLKILFQTIRNLFFHVPMWFAMIALLLGGMISSIRFLSGGRRESDLWASQITSTAMFLGILGILTGMTWANFTWGKPWPNDPKLNSVAIGMLMYSAYFILRGAIDDEEKRSRISAVTNIFFFPIFVVLIFVLPRLTDSLHPGNGGNPGFSSYDLDDTMRRVFYPAVLGWILIGYWISQLMTRARILETDENE